MKKQTQLKWAASVLLLLLVAFVSETGFSEGGKGNRWESRFKKDTPVDVTPKTEKDAVDTSKNTNYGSGNINCRDAFIITNTIFDNPSDPRKSRLKLPAMNNTNEAVYPCTQAQPTMYNNDGFPVTGGDLTVRCENGVVFLKNANCKAKTAAEDKAEKEAAAAAAAAEAARLAEIERQKAAAAAAEAARLAEIERQKEAAAAAAQAQKCPNGCSQNVGSLTTEYQISKNATGRRKYADVYYCSASKEYYVKYTNGSNSYCTKTSPIASSGNSK